MKPTFLFIKIIIFFNLINEIFFMICEKEIPIFKENKCVSVGNSGTKLEGDLIIPSTVENDGKTYIIYG